MTQDFLIMNIPYEKYSTPKNARRQDQFEILHSLWIYTRIDAAEAIRFFSVYSSVDSEVRILSVSANHWIGFHNFEMAISNSKIKSILVDKIWSKKMIWNH